MLRLYAFNAGKGDCIRIRFAETHNIIIDSGVIRFAPKFNQLCREIISSGHTLDSLKSNTGITFITNTITIDQKEIRS